MTKVATEAELDRLVKSHNLEIVKVIDDPMLVEMIEKHDKMVEMQRKLEALIAILQAVGVMLENEMERKAGSTKMVRVDRNGKVLVVAVRSRGDTPEPPAWAAELAQLIKEQENDLGKETG